MLANSETNSHNSDEQELDDRDIKRGEIYYIDLEDIGYGSRFIQVKTRPGLIIQNDIGNLHSQTVIVALMTTSIKKPYPFQYRLHFNNKDCAIMFEQIMTIDKFRIMDRIGQLSPTQMKEAEKCLSHSLQLNQLNLDNIVDFDIESITTKKTRSGTYTYFEFKIQTNQPTPLKIDISFEDIQEYDKIINPNTPFDTIKALFDNCRGLHWLITHQKII